MKKLIIFFSIITVCTVSYPFERFINYATPRKINDIKVKGSTFLAATSGGLYKFDLNTGSGKLFESNALSPDPFLTSVVYDKKGNIWTGSRDGYLTVRYQDGVVKSFSSYFSAGWSINCLYPFGRFLIIGSTNGISLFDTEKMVAQKSATRFKSFISSNVYTCIIKNDSLYLGMDEGVAKLSVEQVINGNFYDPLIWNIDTDVSKPVRSFLPGKGVNPDNVFSVSFKGNILKADSNTLVAGNKKKALPSMITTLNNGGDLCWIGTEEDFFFSWDGENLKHYKIPGPSFDIVNRMSIDKDGKLWVLPRVKLNSKKWWAAINTYFNNEWKYYSMTSEPNFGSVGKGVEHLGIFTDSKNRVWFGLFGGQIKCFDQNENKWIKYCMNHDTKKFYEYAENSLCSWGKTDAIIEDRNGYIWIGVWAQSGFTRYGSLLCYDPRYKPDPAKDNPYEAHYRSFFPENDSYYSENYNSLSVDSSGNIIAGGTDGKIIVFNYNVDPLKNGITVENRFDDYGKVLDMLSMPDGVTKIVTVKGVYDYNPDGGTLTPDEDAYQNTVAIEMEDENIIWAGVQGTGIVRHDFINNDKKVYGRTHGLVSDQITDIVMDHDEGVLWIGTEAGLSKLTLGYSIAKNVKGESVVYPNLYSKNKDAGKRIHFENLDTESNVLIYSIDGSFIEKATPGHITNSGAYYYWVPSERIVPGTYIYMVYTEKIKKSGKIIITP